MMTNEISTVSPTIDSLNLLDPQQLEMFKAFTLPIMRSEKGGIKTFEEAVAIYSRAKELNLPFMTCIEHIHSIKGKIGVDVHIIKTLLLRAGVRWTKTKDNTPLYEYTDGFGVFNGDELPNYCVICSSKQDAEKVTADESNDNIGVYIVPTFQCGDGTIIKSYQITPKHQYITQPNQSQEVIKSGKIPYWRIASKPIDYITEYKFSRNLKIAEGVYENITTFSKFSYKDAINAGFFDKETYKSFPKVMISHRAFTLGANDIAADIIMGCTDTVTLKVLNNEPLNKSDILDISECEIIND